MIKKISIGIILSLIGGISYFFFSYIENFNSNNIKEEKNIGNNSVDLNKHNGILISDLLVKENYDKIGINPEEYEQFEDFLVDFKSFTGVEIDPMNENFTIGIDKEDGSMLFIPFRFQKDKNVFNDNTNKNLAILDIYGAYENGLIYGGINSKYGNKIIFEDEKQHSETITLKKIFDVNLYDKSENVFNIIDSLNKSSEIGLSNTELLAYLYDFTGNYEEAINKRDDICKKYKTNCGKNIRLNISGKILDSNSKPISGAKIELLNNSNITTISEDDGSYFLDFEFYPFAHLRFKSSINGYSDGFSTFSLNDYYSNIGKKDLSINFTLNKAHNTFSINNGNFNDYKKGKYYIIENEYSKYFIPIDGFYYIDGTNYTANSIEVYTYQFTKTSNMDNLLENDTFEPVYGYVGNIMKTFGMPYIQFVDRESQDELFIKSSNPMILQNQVYHMKELYENYDNVYEKLTREDMEFLLKKSEELGGYPIDFDFLTKNNFLRWPARWSLDRVTGIWSNVGCRVLNVDGLVELPFYHIKDT